MRDADGKAWLAVDDPAQTFAAGAFLRTGASGLVGVLLRDGSSLRLAEDTQIAFDSASRIRLATGRVYLDSGRAANRSPVIEIVTPAGIASDVGTQFEVSYVDAAYRVRVREGRVGIRRSDGRPIESVAGEEVSIDATGIVRRDRIASDHEEWRWVEALSPTPDLEGRSVATLLAWVARETGRTVRFEPPEIELKARRTILHGEVRSLAPLEALELMLRTTDLSHTVLEDGTIVVRSRGGRTGF